MLPDPAAVAEATAQRLACFLLATQSLKTPVHLALTGGGTGIAALEHLRANPLLGAISWPDVHLWWGDERFVAAGSKERNELAARRALLDHLPEAPGGIHPVPSIDSGLSLEEAAAHYSAELRRQQVVFDLVLLGMGPDGHVASVFPGSDGGSGTPPPAAFAIPASPKPPPARVSLTLATINASRQVWLVATGPSKRQAVAAALSTPLLPHAVGRPMGDAVQPASSVAGPLPAARVAGREGTAWLIDASAAADA